MTKQSRNMLLKLLANYCIDNKSFVDGVEVPLTDCKKKPLISFRKKYWRHVPRLLFNSKENKFIQIYAYDL
jgi:hypothetical protein